MNINDIDKPESIPENIWKAIFEKQKEVALKYSDIEGMGNLLNETDNIQTANGQKWIKDFSWRVTEEIAEALEAKSLHFEKNAPDEDSQEWVHYQEEMIDALHFLTELTIIAGYNEELFRHEVLPDSESEWKTIYYLGLMCNCLKNKPWKQTQMLTDRQKFEKYLKETWLYFIATLYEEKFTREDIYNFYFKKNEVNKFRIRSKY